MRRRTKERMRTRRRVPDRPVENAAKGRECANQEEADQKTAAEGQRRSTNSEDFHFWIHQKNLLLPFLPSSSSFPPFLSSYGPRHHCGLEDQERIEGLDDRDDGGQQQEEDQGGQQQEEEQALPPPQPQNVWHAPTSKKALARGQSGFSTWYKHKRAPKHKPWDKSYHHSECRQRRNWQKAIKTWIELENEHRVAICFCCCVFCA